MRKISILVMALVVGLGFSQVSMAEGAKEKAAKPASCSHEAKASGLTDKGEIKAFVKKCKADRKASKAK